MTATTSTSNQDYVRLPTGEHLGLAPASVADHHRLPRPCARPESVTVDPGRGRGVESHGSTRRHVRVEGTVGPWLRRHERETRRWAYATVDEGRAMSVAEPRHAPVLTVLRTGNRGKLPWHREAPVDILIDTVQSLPAGAHVLDVGCGAGVFSVWMSSQGMHVTGSRPVPRGHQHGPADHHASQNGVGVTWVSAGLLEFSPDAPYDPVFDSGCLHSLVGGHPTRYKEQLLRWMAPGGRLRPGALGQAASPRLATDRPPTAIAHATRQDYSDPSSSWIGSTRTTSRAPLPFGPTRTRRRLPVQQNMIGVGR